MLASIVCFKQLQLNTQTSCYNNILINNNQYNYCQKSKYLNNVKLTNEIYILQKSNTQLFIHSNNVQKSAIEIQVHNYAVNSFVLFGLSEQQIVSDSLINVSLKFEVFQGALICLKCDVKVLNCTLVFIAAGYQISGILIDASTQLCIQQTFIQYRSQSQHSSGIVNVVNGSDVNILIIDCKLFGFNIVNNGYSGYIATQILQKIVVTIIQFYVCAQDIPTVGNQSVEIIYDGTIERRCDLCNASYYVYGICADSLKYSQDLYGVLQCVYPFEYAYDQCTCAQGYVLDQQSCVNVIQIINIALNQSLNSDKLAKLENKLVEIDHSLSQNISEVHSLIYFLENQALSNITQLQLNLQNNTQILDQRIYGNQTVLENIIKANSSVLENLISQNTTVLDWRIYNNVSALKTNISFIQNNFLTLNQSVSAFQLDVFKIISDIQTTHQIQIQNIQDIIAKLINQVNCTNNVGYQYLNDSCVLAACSIAGQERVNGICRCVNTNEIVQDGSCICPQNSTLIGSICTCPQNSHFISGVCVCDEISGQTLVAGKCTCSSGLSVFNGVCQLILNGRDGTFQCSQSVYVSVFDIETLTHSISSINFSTGYVFSSEIQDAYINVSDNVYTTVKPLFQSQSSFTNLKIQFGVQTINGGSLILSSSASIKINQMNIVSKPTSLITLSASQLNILANSPSSAIINNLLVNLSFASSSGNITLINIINGDLKIAGYQVLGDYISTQTVALICINILIANVNINQISFKPSTFNVGNCSSYLFGNILSTTSTVILIINNITVLIGSNQNFILMASISSSSSNYYLFGGITAIINSASLVSVDNVIIDSYQKFSSSYVSNSGFLVGFVLVGSSAIMLKNLCIQQDITSTTDFSLSGIIGRNSGNTTIQCASITISAQGLYFGNFGIVGHQYQNSIYAEVIDLKTSLYVSSSTGQGVGVIFGYENANNCTIQNTNVIEGNISSYYGIQQVGGIIGWLNSCIVILNSSISNTNITGQIYIGGIIGGQSSNANTSILVFSIQNTEIFGSSSLGGVIGVQSSNVIIINSSISNTNLSGSDCVGGIIGQCLSKLYLTNTNIQFMRCVSSSHFWHCSRTWRNVLVYKFNCDFKLHQRCQTT
ncbi:Conserved_hypothetical protein [Hexamita inflata]|uniref:Transmembrane protein n=1 Tax=Hexamita inflata TaxID=28002 RepID=A0AA86PX59_9EUKA|nr:Conserved hypothetical protein [Hexamita inflata]